jgi:hypothetical protein
MTALTFMFIILSLTSCAIGVITGSNMVAAMCDEKWQTARKYAIGALILALVVGLLFAALADLLVVHAASTHALNLPLIVGGEVIFTIPPLPTPAPTPGG